MVTQDLLSTLRKRAGLGIGIAIAGVLAVVSPFLSCGSVFGKTELTANEQQVVKAMLTPIPAQAGNPNNPITPEVEFSQNPRGTLFADFSHIFFWLPLNSQVDRLLKEIRL